MSFRRYQPPYTGKCVSKLLSFSKQVNQARLYCLGVYEVNKLHPIGDDSGDELYRMFNHSYQIEESRFSKEFHYASLGNFREESIRPECEHDILNHHANSAYWAKLW